MSETRSNNHDSKQEKSDQAEKEIKIKIEPGLPEKNHHPLSKGNLMAAARVLRGKNKAPYNCMSLTKGMLQYIKSGDMPNEPAKRTNGTLEEFSYHYDYEPIKIKREDNTEKYSSTSAMVRISIDYDEDHFIGILPETEHVDIDSEIETRSLDLTKGKQYAHKCHYTDIDKTLLALAAGDTLAGYILLPRPNPIKRKYSSHFILFYISENQIFYIDCKMINIQDSLAIFSKFSETYEPSFRKNDFTPDCFILPIERVPRKKQVKDSSTSNNSEYQIQTNNNSCTSSILSQIKRKQPDYNENESKQERIVTKKKKSEIIANTNNNNNETSEQIKLLPEEKWPNIHPTKYTSKFLKDTLSCQICLNQSVEYENRSWFYIVIKRNNFIISPFLTIMIEDMGINLSHDEILDKFIFFKVDYEAELDKKLIKIKKDDAKCTKIDSFFISFDPLSDEGKKWINYVNNNKSKYDQNQPSEEEKLNSSKIQLKRKSNAKENSLDYSNINSNIIYDALCFESESTNEFIEKPEATENPLIARVVVENMVNKINEAIKHSSSFFNDEKKNVLNKKITRFMDFINQLESKTLGWKPDTLFNQNDIPLSQQLSIQEDQSKKNENQRKVS